MNPPAPRPSRGLDLEAWLGPGPRRLLAALLAVLLSAGLTTLLFREFGWRRQESEFPYELLFAEQALGFGVWALIAGPLFKLARWIHGRARPALFGLLLQLALALGASYGMAVLGGELQSRLVWPALESRWARPAASNAAPAVREPQRAGAEGLEATSPEATSPEATNSGANSSEETSSEGQGFEGQSSESAARPAGQRRGERGWDRRGADRRGQAFLWMRLPREVAIYVALLGLAAASTSFLERRRAERQSADLALASARLEGELLRARLESLGQRLQPHFLFNALHAVGGLVRAQRSEAALGALSDLAELLRLSLEHGSKAVVPLGLELDLIERYLAFEGRRFGARLEVEVDVPGECLSARVPSLVLLPLVENAVKHGVSPRPDGGRVQVAAERRGARLRLTIEDGPRRGAPPDAAAGAAGAEPGAAAPGPSLGLGQGLVRERLALLYGQRASFVVEARAAGGSAAVLELDFEAGEASDGGA
jgi:hypothetical protein